MSLKLGVIGGTGQLGRAIITGLVTSKFINPTSLWVSNRSGSEHPPAHFEGAHFTTSNKELTDTCDVILLSVPPKSFSSIEINASDKLIISVMAGVTAQQIAHRTGAERVIRAMSSPAAEYCLAYAPWFASENVTGDDRSYVSRLFEACGTTDEIDDEKHLDVFTALTGPVPGFVALFAEIMVDYASERGISPIIADRAIRQLFKASGHILATEDKQPGRHVAEMIAYAGTTAAGLEGMKIY